MTLRGQLKLINFRKIEEELVGMYHYNSKTVRIYFDIDDWFEFGIYDFGTERSKKIEEILTKKLLDSEVNSINLAEELYIIEIYLV